MKRPLISAFAALFLFPAAISAFAAPAQDLGYCTTCHGAQGNGNNAIRAPKLAGMAAWYVANQLAAFRAGWRGSEDGDLAGREMQRVALARSNRRRSLRGMSPLPCRATPPAARVFTQPAPLATAPPAKARQRCRRRHCTVKVTGIS